MDVRDLQAALTARGYAPGAVDGVFGKKTKAALLAALTGNPARLSAADIKDEADRLGLPVSHVGAVYDVESRGAGFDPVTKRPIILYEPHVFHRETGGKFDVHGTFSYPEWGARPYPKSQDERYEQLMAAARLDPDAALASASWGLFQIMGFNAASAGFETPDEQPDTFAFALAMAQNEAAQLRAFGAFISSSSLLAKLKRCTTDPATCEPFCKGYNGKGYAKNGYHTKLAAAIKRRSA